MDAIVSGYLIGAGSILLMRSLDLLVLGDRVSLLVVVAVATVGAIGGEPLLLVVGVRRSIGESSVGWESWIVIRVIGHLFFVEVFWLVSQLFLKKKNNLRHCNRTTSTSRSLFSSLNTSMCEFMEEGVRYNK